MCNPKQTEEPIQVTDEVPTFVPAETEEIPELEKREEFVIQDGKLYMAIIWHQHQPVYFKDPDSGVYEKPWVRVHAAKDYVDMAAILQQYPKIHATFNLTPSLIRQLDDISAGTKDLYWLYTEIPAEELSAEQRQFILDHFFDINPKIIDRFPRYQELSQARSEHAVATWTPQDFRDLQVLSNLAWTDPDWLLNDPLSSLVTKGEGYSEDDKDIVLNEHLRLVKEVIPIHTELQNAGQIEITMTPYAHPILPLVVDSDLASITLPDVDLPTHFFHGQNAVVQVKLGVQL
jgi:alpha-amylase/alpha-mannosidase (GH57 family)